VDFDSSQLCSCSESLPNNFDFSAQPPNFAYPVSALSFRRLLDFSEFQPEESR